MARGGMVGAVLCLASSIAGCGLFGSDHSRADADPRVDPHGRNTDEPGDDGDSNADGNGAGESADPDNQNEPPPCLDADGDGHSCGDDCDDGEPGVHPGAPEVALDGVDQDCDGLDRGNCSDEQLARVYDVTFGVRSVSCMATRPGEVVGGGGYSFDYGDCRGRLRLPQDARCSELGASLPFEASIGECSSAGPDDDPSPGVPVRAALEIRFDNHDWLAGGTNDLYGTLLDDGVSCMVTGSLTVEAVVAEGSTGLAPLDFGGLAWAERAPMKAARSGFAITALQDGRILVAGGYDGTGCGSVTPGVEIWDPDADEWADGPDVELYSASSGTQGIGGASAALLPDGRVFMTGGANDGSCTPLSYALFYVPGDDALVPTAPSPNGLYAPRLHVLEDGKVLVLGRAGGNWIFDPAKEEWEPAAPGQADWAEGGSAWSSLRADGSVIAVGGHATDWQYVEPGPVDLFQSDGLKTLSVDDLPCYVDGPQGGILPNDGVLAFGEESYPECGGVFILDGQTWSKGPPMLSPRRGPGARGLAVAGGRVLAAGGMGGDAREVLAEVFDPVVRKWVPTGSLKHGRNRPEIALVHGGCTVAIVGGEGESGDPLASVESLALPDGAPCGTGACSVGRCVAP